MKAAKKEQEVAPAPKSTKPTGQAGAEAKPTTQGKAAPDKKDAAPGAAARGPGVTEGSKNDSTKPGGGPGSS
jgi:hypothetical protein